MSPRATDSEIIHSLTEALPVGIWVGRAPNGEFVYANRTFREIMGMDARADVARGEFAAPYGIHGLDGAPYPEDRMPFVQALTARRVVVVDDIVIHRTDGRRVNIRAFARPVLNDDGEVDHVVVAFFDITEQVLAQRAREESEARVRAAQRMETLGEMAAGIAHDFNNLLAAIKLLSEGAILRASGSEFRETLESIESAADSGARLTRSLLEFSRRGRTSVERTPFNEIVRSIVEIGRRTHARGRDLDLQLGSAVPEVIGAASQLEQVVMNLLVNAAEATPRGGRIVIRTDESDVDARAAEVDGRLLPGRYVTLEVIDTGSGIEASLRDRIFEPYVSSKQSGPSKGTGLGLSTVYGIAAAHGGLAEVVSTGPEGTTMRVWLPVAPTVQAAARGTDPERPLVGGRGVVLVVDDEAMVRDSCAQTLSFLGYRVLVAADGTEALARFETHRESIAAIVMDIVMPGISGIEAAARIRERVPTVPVIFTSGLPVPDADLQRFDDKITEFLPKPYRVTALADAISRRVAAAGASQAVTPRREKPAEPSAR